MYFKIQINYNKNVAINSKLEAKTNCYYLFQKQKNVKTYLVCRHLYEDLW